MAIRDEERANRDIVYQDPRWHVSHGQRQLVVPSEAYCWDNRGRGDDTYVVQYIVAGQMYFEHAGQHSVIGKGTLLCFAHGEESSYGTLRDDPSELKLLWISIEGRGLREQWRWLMERGERVFQLASTASIPQQLDYLITRFEQHHHRTDLAPRIHQLFDDIVAAQDERRQAGQSPLEWAVERLFTAPLMVADISSLAQEAGVSREHLSRAFSERHGRSPGQWLTDRRLERATYLLQQSDLRVAAIAEDCGYGSANVLARAMRQRYHCGPSEFRERHR